MIEPSSPKSYNDDNPALQALATFLDQSAEVIVRRAERAWDSSILLYAQLSDAQREQIRHLAVDTIHVLALRLRQDPAYARIVHELGQEWGSQAATWNLHVYSFTRMIDLLARTIWEFVTTNYVMEELSATTVLTLGRSRDAVLEDIRVPLLTIYTQQVEHGMEETRFSLQSPITLPGRSLLQELGSRLNANKDRMIPSWIDSVRKSPGSTRAMEKLLSRQAGTLFDQLLSLLQSPTPETGAASMETVREIGLDSAQAGVSFQQMFHALQQLRPILWETVYEIYRREQYWHPAEFIEVMARLHLLLDLFSEGIGQAYLQQKEMIIQEQAEELRRRDLNLAREILESLLPMQRLTLPHTDIGTVWEPSREIGGDFYDIFPVGNDEYMLLVGDVSGKGISAALLVSMVKYVIKANAPWYRSPAALLTVANRLFYQDMGPELFVTLFIARYAPATGRIVYSNAGHEPGYLCRNRTATRFTEMSSLGPALGIFPEVDLQDKRLWMHPGDTLLLYTDGLVNIRCQGHMPEDSDHLCQALEQFAGETAQTIVHRLVETMVNGCESTDDITVLVAKRE